MKARIWVYIIGNSQYVKFPTYKLTNRCVEMMFSFNNKNLTLCWFDGNALFHRKETYLNEWF